jgi:hypothetical protein
MRVWAVGALRPRDAGSEAQEQWRTTAVSPNRDSQGTALIR